MEPMRESWTDERLNDLNAKVDRGFDRIDKDVRGLRMETKTEFTALRGEMKAGFDRVDARFERIDRRLERIDQRFEGVDQRFEQMDRRFERINGRLEGIPRLLSRSAGVLIVALIGLKAAPFCPSCAAPDTAASTAPRCIRTCR